MSVSIISDVPISSTDTSALAAELRSNARGASPAKPVSASPSPTAPEPAEPRRFAGKSREDIMEMYLNLEKHDGRLANETGQLRNAINELLVEKRARDLAANGAREPVKVDTTELLQRPTEALDPFIEERVTRAVSPIHEKLSRLEQMLGASVFANHHADAQDVTESAEFKEWVKETPLRRSIANLAANGNTQAADELLTEFKGSRKARAARAESDEQERLSAAQRVSFEQSRTGNDGTPAKKGREYSRAEMRALMQSAAYASDESLREEVSRAYIEGRVKGS